MRKMFLFLFAATCCSLLLNAQAYEGSIEYEKKKQDAFIIDYPFPAEAAENAIIARLEKMGYRPKEEKGLFNKDKGFKVYKSAFITDISASNMDYLFKVERKSRRDKDESVIYMVVLSNGSNAKSVMAADDVDRAKSFLAGLQPDVEAANLELQIKAQEDVIAKAEKKLRGLKDDQSDLEKKLEKNKKEQADTELDITNQKQMLENLKAKRVTNN